MLNSGIYIIVNIINNKFYIGSTINLKRRFYNHKSSLKYNKHENARLQHAWNKYGSENFSFQILENVDDKTKLIEREQFFIDASKCYKREIGYNILPKAGSSLGFRPTNETRIKLSIARKNMTDETKRKISESQKGKFVSEETRYKMSIWQKGKTSFHRDVNKWPCKDANKCKCDVCIEKRKEIRKIWESKQVGRYAVKC